MSANSNTPANVRVDDNSSITDLFRNLRDESVTLFQQEVSLAKTEMSEKAGLAGRNIGYLAVGGLIAFAGFLTLLAAVTVLVSLGLQEAGMDADVARWLAPLILGLIVTGGGIALILKAKTTLTNSTFVPEKTIKSLKEDKQWVQNKVS